jgi:hypothetical protein
MISMQMGAHDDIDIVGGEAAYTHLVQECRRATLMPGGTVWPVLIVTDTSVHQNGETACPDDETVKAHHHDVFSGKKIGS